MDDALEGLKRENKPVPRAPRRPRPSGKILVRITPELHERLALKAIAAGVSLNELCAARLSV